MAENIAEDMKYLSGTLVKVFVTKVYKDTGNVVQSYGAETKEMWLEDCIAISWQTRQPKIPVYGHASHFYDAVMGGNVQVVGQIAMVLDYPSKFYNAIMKQPQATSNEPKSAFNMTEFHDLKTDVNAGGFNIIIIYGNVPYDELLGRNLTSNSRGLTGERIVDVHIDGVSNAISQDDNPVMKVLSFTAKRTETLNFEQATTSYSNRLFDVFNEQLQTEKKRIVATFYTMQTEMNVVDSSVQIDITPETDLRTIARTASVSLGLSSTDPMLLIISIAGDLGPYANYFKRQSTGELTNIIAGDLPKTPDTISVSNDNVMREGDITRGLGQNEYVKNIIWQGKYREIDDPTFEKISTTLQRRLMSLNQ